MSAIAARSASAAPPLGYEIIAPGVIRIDSALPFRGLRQVNLWLLRDGDGWTMIDCGFGSAEVRAALQGVWDEVLEGRAIRRLIVTHFHPDHMGNCRWIAQRFGLTPFVAPSEWMAAQLAIRDLYTDDIASAARFYKRHGLDQAVIERYQNEFILYARCVELSDEYQGLSHHDVLHIDGQSWRVMCLGGHSPALVGLYSAERKIYIAGDQILPKITPNISVVHWEPLADPLSVYLKSLDLLKAEIADDVMVLPSHQLPFHGLHRRIDELRAHHHQRLDHLRVLLRDKNQLNAAEAMLSLFGQNLDGQQIFFAMGEALAHLNYLYARGEISCVRGHEGAYLYQIGH